MICSDIWHKYHEWYFEPLGEWNLRQFWNITSSIYAKYHVQIMLLFVYTTNRKRFVIFTGRYFKLSWNTTALSQWNCRNFWFSSITAIIGQCNRTVHTIRWYLNGFLFLLLVKNSHNCLCFNFKKAWNITHFVMVMINW